MTSCSSAPGVLHVVLDEALVAAAGVAAVDLADEVLAVGLGGAVLEGPRVVDGADLAADVLHGVFGLALDDGHTQAVFGAGARGPGACLTATDDDDVVRAAVGDERLVDGRLGGAPSRGGLALPAVRRRGVHGFGLGAAVHGVFLLQLVKGVLRLGCSLVCQGGDRRGGHRGCRQGRRALDEVATGHVLRLDFHDRILSQSVAACGRAWPAGWAGRAPGWRPVGSGCTCGNRGRGTRKRAARNRDPTPGVQSPKAGRSACPADDVDDGARAAARVSHRVRDSRDDGNR